MAHLITGLFVDSKEAGNAVSELKTKGYAKDISLIAKDEDSGKVESHTVKQDGTEGAATGATVGAVVGAGATLLAGITAVLVPGIGLVAGSLAVALAAATTGAVAGGLIGYLVDKGIPENKAKEYQDRIEAGDVLIAVEADHENESAIADILSTYGAVDIEHAHTA